MILPLDGDATSGWKPGKPFVFLSTPAQETQPTFSPDGRWIAYLSNESGTLQLFVRPFPGPGGKWQISATGAICLAWSRTSHELLYLGTDQRVMSVTYTVEGDSFKADKPHVWSEQPVLRLPRNTSFDLHPDGLRIAAAVPTGQATERLDKITLVLSFSNQLRSK